MEEEFSVIEAEQGHLPDVEDVQNHFQFIGA
jgi:hypothetical protein